MPREMRRGRVIGGRIALATLAAVPACTGTAGASGEADEAPQSFTAQLDRGTTAETVIPQILAAAHGQLAVVCEAQPGASVRIFNPLASGAYQDVSCVSVLDDGTSEASAALVSDHGDEPIAEAQQRLGPISLLACGVAGITSTLFTRYALCPHGSTERARENCNDVALWGNIGIGVLCMIPF